MSPRRTAPRPWRNAIVPLAAELDRDAKANVRRAAVGPCGLLRTKERFAWTKLYEQG